jgi:RNA polymerase sigma factor (sigma-70 family)
MQPLDEIVALIPDLRRFARALARDRDKADDLVQDVLERSVRKIGSWRREGRLKSWLFQIMVNIHSDQKRRYSVSGHLLTIEMADASGTTPAGQADPGHLMDIRQAFDRLSADHRQVLMLVGVEGASIAEAALMLGLPKGTVLSRLARARTALRAMTETDAPGEADLAAKARLAAMDATS